MLASSLGLKQYGGLHQVHCKDGHMGVYCSLVSIFDPSTYDIHWFSQQYYSLLTIASLSSTMHPVKMQYLMRNDLRDKTKSAILWFGFCGRSHHLVHLPMANVAEYFGLLPSAFSDFLTLTLYGSLWERVFIQSCSKDLAICVYMSHDV